MALLQRHLGWHHEKLDYILIRVSPVVQNIPNDNLYGDAYYCGYWPQNLYALNDHFGPVDDLNNLISKVHNRGIVSWLMLLLITWLRSSTVTRRNWTTTQNLIPFNDREYYHPYCNVTNWNDPGNSIRVAGLVCLWWCFSRYCMYNNLQWFKIRLSNSFPWLL